MTEKLKQLIEKRNTLAAAERSHLEKIEAEGRQSEASEVEQYEKRAAELDTVEKEIEAVAKWEERKAKAKERDERASLPINDPERPNGGREAVNPEQREAFASFLRTGLIQSRGLVASEDNKGGYFAPKEFVSDLIKAETELCPFRSLAKVRTTSFRSVQQPKRTGQFSAVWVGETTTRTETDGLRFGLEEIPTHEMSAVVKVSEQDLEDTSVDLEAMIRDEGAEQFAVAETVSFITGNGVAKPWGFTADTAITATNSGTNGDFDADDLIDLLLSLKGVYQASATWLFNRVTMRKIRKLKSNNEYIWAPADNYPNNIVSGLPGSILGRPYQIAPEMANTGSTGNKSVAVGAFKRGYQIIDRVQMSVKRDPYTAAGTGEIVFWMRKRVGGQVILGEAINILAEQS